MTKEELSAQISANVLQTLKDHNVKYPATKQGEKCVVKAVKHIVKQQEQLYNVKVTYILDVSVRYGLKLNLSVVQD